MKPRNFPGRKARRKYNSIKRAAGVYPLEHELIKDIRMRLGNSKRIPPTYGLTV